MITYTFLGSGHPALAMYMEILYSLHGKNFAVKVIRNMQIQDDTPFRIPGIDCQELMVADWEPSVNDRYILGVNKPESKAIVQAFFQEKAGIDTTQYEILIDPTAIIASTASLATGVVINPGTVVGAFAQLEEMVSVNRMVSVGHHTRIGRFATIQPGVDIAGKCDIGAHVTIGMGANVIDGITIGENSTIGAGSLVTKNIPANVIAYGVPAAIVREKIIK